MAKVRYAINGVTSRIAGSPSDTAVIAFWPKSVAIRIA